MKGHKQLGADLMTERVIREISQEKQLLAEPKPINVAAWDEAIITELGHTNDEMGPTDLTLASASSDVIRWNRVLLSHTLDAVPTEFRWCRGPKTAASASGRGEWGAFGMTPDCVAVYSGWRPLASRHLPVPLP